MTVKYFDRVLETTTTSGTGPLTLLGPLAGFRSFSVAGNGALVPYAIDETTKWEVGIGTVTVGSPNTLARTTVLASSNSGALENFGSNVKNVRMAPLAPLFMGRDEALNFTDLMGVGGGAANAHTVTMPVPPLGYTNGALIMYRATVANTAASVTVNVMGPNSTLLGAKALKINGSDPAIGQIAIGTLIVGVYNTTTGVFDVISIQSANLTIAENWAKSVDIASAATVDLGTATGNYVTITGTTTVTAFGAVQAGATRILRFAGALTLTHNATSLILPGAANIITTVGDMAEFVSEGAGNWRCIDYQRANGQALVFLSASQAKAWVNFDGTTAANLSGTYTRSGTTITISATAHGHVVGNRVNATFVGGATSGLYLVVSVIDANTFTVTDSTSGAITSNTVTLNRKLIKSSFNVSSVTTEQAGYVTINFPAGVLADASYSMTGSSIMVSGNAPIVFENGSNSPLKTNAAISINILNGASSFGAVDRPSVSVQIFGN